MLVRSLSLLSLVLRSTSNRESILSNRINHLPSALLEREVQKGSESGRIVSLSPDGYVSVDEQKLQIDSRDELLYCLSFVWCTM